MQEFDHTDHTIDPSTSEPEEWRLPSARRVLMVLAVLLFLLAIVIVPPLITANRLQHRIARSIGDSLGRPVHLDNVTLNILPWPGFTLQNFVVSEDPAFGSEPTIRANTVTARLRIRSLWRHQVEFAKITFTDPSLNLVRNADGQWNIETILLQAEHVAAAPTSQSGAGPAPRFPYIEATGARINIKTSQEKLPLSLSDADFALWLPQPDQWHLRLESPDRGAFIRTDNNLSDTGKLNIEGTINRAAAFNDLPIALTADWSNAPLGAVSVLFTGRDAGWRGNLDLNTTLTGTIGSATLSARARLSELRRADPYPARTLDLDLHCQAKTVFTSGSLNDIACFLPVGSNSQISILGNLPDIYHLDTAHLQVGSVAVPLAWCMDWARLFTRQIPPNLALQGNLSGTLTHDNGWSGFLHSTMSLGNQSLGNTPLESTSISDNTLDASLQLAQSTLTLQPSPVHLGKDLQGTLTGAFTRSGYNLHLAATGPGTHLLDVSSILPAATEGLDKLADKLTDKITGKPTVTSASKLDITCTRTWGSPQTCTTTPEPTRKKHR